MSDINKLRLLAFEKVYEDEDLCCPSVKKQVLNYMKEADEYDVKAYLLDGDLDIVEEDAKPIIDERFERSEIKEDLENLNEVDPMTAWLGVSAAGAATALIGVGAVFTGKVVQVIKRNLEKCGRKCKKYQKDGENRKFKACLLQCRLEANEETLKALKKQDCSKAKDPDKCKEKTKNAIQKLEKKIKQRKEKIKDLTKAD